MGYFKVFSGQNAGKILKSLLKPLFQDYKRLSLERAACMDTLMQ